MFALAACALALIGPSVEPVFQFGADGSFSLPGRLLPGTRLVRTPHGTGLDFDGDHCGIELADFPQLRLTGSVSISAWLNLRSYVTEHNTSPGSQVLFRGDDRSGLDPYHLTVQRDGTIAFVIEGAETSAFVSTPIELNRWVHIVGSFDVGTRSMKLWKDGGLVATSVAACAPLGVLEADGGVGIGNVQRSSAGLHNMPVNGILAQLRLYNVPVTPADAGFVAQPYFGKGEG